MCNNNEHTCLLCGAKDDYEKYTNNSACVQIMKEKGVCYQCAFWINIIKHPYPNAQIIGHRYYVFNQQIKRPFNKFLGFNKGKEFYIRKADESLEKSNNVCLIGEIPQHFWNQLRNTANFISMSVYMKLLRYPFKCKAKGCWNRYHCLRYDFNCEKDGPFNIIPDNYKIGSDRCQSFININELKNE